MEQPFRTLVAETRHETAKVRGSRFIATAGPFAGTDPLRERIVALRSEFAEANHHVYAWRLGQQFRYSDDGEPSGTAGRPILQQIDGRDLDRVFVIVTRIFGGTKLGAGGLVRAYGGAARELLDSASIVEVVPTRAVSVEVPYGLKGTIESVARSASLEPTQSSYGEQVSLVYDVPLAALDEFVRQIRERTSARARVELAPLDPQR